MGGCDHSWCHYESLWWFTCSKCEHQRWDGRRTICGPPQAPGLEKEHNVIFFARASPSNIRMEGVIERFFMKAIGSTEAVYAFVSASGNVYEVPVTRLQHASVVDALGSLYE